MGSKMSEDFMKTGTAVPLGALVTEKSCGVGEYLDLIPFSDFCKKAGLSIIQLLPVNDTGTESSPYSALSAFALHPIYISIDSLPEFLQTEDACKKLSTIQQKFNQYGRFPYQQIRTEKLDLLRFIYSKNHLQIKENKDLKKWIKSNQWIREYSVFMEYKRQNLDASWKQWKNTHLTLQEIISEWENPQTQTDHLFFAWVQFRAHEQFLKAAKYIRNQGILLKGDIPIMMNEDSCDAWAYPEFFNEDMRAGSPPDAQNPFGQNWGFPTYNWDSLKSSDYSWWRQRLILASQYYDIYRIDHVLGFFRIWATNQRENVALMGWPLPFESITTKDLLSLGFDQNRIRWLSEPHVPTRSIEEVNNNDYLSTHGFLHKIMDRIGDEELWLFKNEIQGEKDIFNTDLPIQVKEKLASYWRDRMFIKTSKDNFSPLWTFSETTSWKSLSSDEQKSLTTLIDSKQQKMEKLWEKQAQTLLGELTSTTTMLPCAEDLGAMPLSVPKVLKKLNIYSLRVIRWSREWEKSGHPFIPFKKYPRQSVTVSSVHDSSTLRLWWLSEKDAADFYKEFPPSDNDSESCITPGVFNEKTAFYLLEKAALSNSAFCIHPIQDFLSLNKTYYNENPESERVNIPGSVTNFNWTYKLPVSIKILSEDKKLIERIHSIVDIHTKNK